MKHSCYMIASDLHGSALYTRRLLEQYRASGAELLILLGDLLYHGPRNPLPEGYDPAAVASLLNPLAKSIVAVRGNCDAEVDQMLLQFPMMADYTLLPVDGHRLFLTHGHLYETAPPPLAKGDVYIQGHTHVPACLHHPGGWWKLNPGSVTLPKEDSPRGYLLLEDGVFSWRTLEGREYKAFPLNDDHTTSARSLF